MGDLYDTDILTWSERQAALLRRLAAGERVNEELDWANVVEEVESVGRGELHAVESLLTRALPHEMKARAWPDAAAVRTGEPKLGCSASRWTNCWTTTRRADGRGGTRHPDAPLSASGRRTSSARSAT